MHCNLPQRLHGVLTNNPTRKDVMKSIQERLKKALEHSTQFKCAVESGVSIPTIQNIVGGKKVSPQTEEKLNNWIERQGKK